MYNIKQAAARAGVSVPVLRAWERRYAIVDPARTASGYRQFDDEAVDRVRAMRELVDAGWAPSAAAAAILDGSAPASSVATSEPSPSTHASPAPDPGAFTERFVAAAEALDPAAVEAVLDDVFIRGSFERVASDVLFPALRGLGEAWAAGRVSVAGEHLASAAVLRRLGVALDSAARRGRPADAASRQVLIGLPPGARHELGALAFAVAASRGGLPVTYLGPDLPVEDWLRSAPGARAAVVGIVTARDRAAGLEVARQLRAADPDLVIALGGPAVPEPRPDSATLLLPASLTDAVDALADAIVQREGRTPS